MPGDEREIEAVARALCHISIGGEAWAPLAVHQIYIDARWPEFREPARAAIAALDKARKG